MQNQRSRSHALPRELAKFLTRESYLLLIKGGSGTGKTALVLTLLRDLDLLTNCLYVSTRFSPAQLLDDFPWLRRYVPSVEKRRTEKEPELGAQSSSFVDGRLDEPPTLFERITSEMMDVGGPAIVVDSWDPIGNVMDDEALQSNTRVLETWRDRARAKLFLVVEDPKDATFDPLASGIVVLRQKYDGGAMAREMIIQKLHGVDVERSTYPFSLRGGLFRLLKSGPGGAH